MHVFLLCCHQHWVWGACTSCMALQYLHVVQSSAGPRFRTGCWAVGAQPQHACGACICAMLPHACLLLGAFRQPLGPDSAALRPSACAVHDTFGPSLSCVLGFRALRIVGAVAHCTTLDGMCWVNVFCNVVLLTAKSWLELTWGS
jgi:hypothetical protein